MKRYSVFLFLLLLAGACADDKIVPAKGDKIITLIIDPAVNTTASGDWLIIHGTDGQLLFSQLFDSGDTVATAQTYFIACSPNRLWIAGTGQISSRFALPDFA